MQLTEILALQQIRGVGNKSLISLIEFCQANEIESFSDLQRLDLSDAPKLKRVSSAIKSFFSEGLYEGVLRECETRLKEWEARSITVIPYGSESYPIQLTALSDPPAILYCRGNLALLKAYKSIAVVGTRKNTRLGEAIARKTVEYFSKSGFCVVSGLALGIDAIAHRAALEHHGATISVLVDVVNVSPSQNRPLAQEILEQEGLLVSENPPDTKVIPALFAKRDRIQAGLSAAVFAIETAIDGGTMHAVRAAKDLKRPVYVPDPIAAKYPDLNEKAISGTQKLVIDEVARAYSRDTYALITAELESRASAYSNLIPNTGSLL